MSPLADTATAFTGEIIITAQQGDEIVELKTFISFGCPLFTPYTDADILTILATNVNLVSKHYSQIHVIFLEEIDHISENSIRNVLWGEKICFLRLKHKYWQRDTKGMHSEGPRGMVPSHLLALRLPSIHISSTTCLDYTCSYCWPNTLSLTMSILRAFLPTKSKKTVFYSVFEWTFMSIVGYAFFIFWEHDLQMKSVGVFY